MVLHPEYQEAIEGKEKHTVTTSEVIKEKSKEGWYQPFPI